MERQIVIREISKFDTVRTPRSRRAPIFTDIKQAFLENIARLSLHEMVSEKL